MLQCRAWQGRGRFWWSCSEAGAALHLAPTLPVPGIFQPLFTFPCSLRAPLCLSLRWITGKGEVASSGFRFCFIINCGQMSLEDQHGVGWAVEGDWTASPVCVPRGSIWAPEHQCLSRARECVHSLGGTRGAVQGLLLQPSLFPMSSKQKTLCPVHGPCGPCPHFITKHGYFGKRRTKAGRVAL